MKKIFFAIAAIAAMASCTKTEVQYADESAISFAPVSRLSTKAAVHSTDYPDALNMYVFANAGLDGTDANTTVDLAECTDTYFANAEFANGTHDDHVFGGVTPYYWPNVKSLWFAGVSRSGNINNGSTPTVDFAANTITVNGYQPGEGSLTQGDNDLMYFVPIGPYSKATNATTPVTVTMKHACSWITVKVAGNAVSGASNTTWEIVDLKMTGLATSGNLTVTAGVVAWAEGDKTGEFGLKTANANVKLTQTLTDLLTTTNAVVIPQAPATLYVKYQYVSQPAQGTSGQDGYVPAIVTVEETNIPLTYNGTAEWLPGYHYTYDLTISAGEILLQPSAEVWTEYDHDSATDGNQNIPLNK